MKTQEKTEFDNPYASPRARIGSTFLPEIYAGKLYPPLSISIASLFGGFLAAGLLIQSNFRHFGQSTAAITTIILTIAATTSYLFASLIIGRVPLLFYLVVNFIIALVIMPLCILLQGKRLELHEDAGRAFHTNIHAAVIGVLCFFAMVIILASATWLFSIFLRI